MHVRVVGAGLSGAVVARELACAGHRVTVTEARQHVAGNCHTERCAETGVMEHRYGPHIFHTDDEEVWTYVRRFATFRDYRHQVRTTHAGRVYPLPVTLQTINQFYGTALGPAEARAFISREAEPISAPGNFEEQALSMVGRPIYEAFFKGYTQKQWGRDPRELPAAILKRLPLRFSYNDNYFFHRFQGIPEAGYTDMIEAILNHSEIDVHLNDAFVPGDDPRADHMVWTGPLDAWFGHRLGRLGYRTLDFERFTAEGDWQGCAVMNYADTDVPYTRITEHKHFAPWEDHAGSVLYRETSREAGSDDIPYYPIRLAEEKAMLSDYEHLARQETGITFLGRLGTYRYLDMDVSIREALNAAKDLLQS